MIIGSCNDRMIIRIVHEGELVVVGPDLDLYQTTTRPTPVLLPLLSNQGIGVV